MQGNFESEGGILSEASSLAYGPMKVEGFDLQPYL